MRGGACAIAKPRSPSGSVLNRCTVHASTVVNSVASPTFNPFDMSPMRSNIFSRVSADCGARRIFALFT